ncbi:MAG: DUF3786 domain-containing protein [Peptococcaceae bacterium]|nr:MAG: DUF3786 domain-containing protein [Peptococcaceae bacterium]
MVYMNLRPAIEKAREKLVRCNPGLVSSRAKVIYDQSAGYFKVPFLGCEYNVSFPGGEVTETEGRSVPPDVRLLLLHYLTGASGAPVSGRLISFKELPDGMLYNEPFIGRAVKPLVKIFGQAPEKLVEAAEKLGGRQVSLGDAGVTIPFFPLAPVTYVIWLGDDEFPASGSILFDASAASHLATEDYAVMAGMGVFKMREMIAGRE